MHLFYGWHNFSFTAFAPGFGLENAISIILHYWGKDLKGFLLHSLLFFTLHSLLFFSFLFFGHKNVGSSLGLLAVKYFTMLRQQKQRPTNPPYKCRPTSLPRSTPLLTSSLTISLSLSINSPSFSVWIVCHHNICLGQKRVRRNWNLPAATVNVARQGVCASVRVCECACDVWICCENWMAYAHFVASDKI